MTGGQWYDHNFRQFFCEKMAFYFKTNVRIQILQKWQYLVQKLQFLSPKKVAKNIFNNIWPTPPWKLINASTNFWRQTRMAAAAAWCRSCELVPVIIHKRTKLRKAE
jgi:hypothetical protein